MIRIAIVNDVKMAIEVLRRVVISLPDAEVAWIAEDGQQAVDKCLADRPDIVLMDLIMPVMDGVEATRRIMRQCPCPILVVTATVSGNCSKVFESLGDGALDAVNTPVFGRDGNIAGADDLIRKIRYIVRLRCGKAAGLEVATPASRVAPSEISRDATPMLVIGASTGGPQALATVLAGLAHPLQYAVVVVQHLDKLFVPGLTEWLGKETHSTVQKIDPGQRPTVGTIHVACTSDHLVLSNTGVFQYVREPAGHAYRPSVDVFFESLLKSHAAPGAALLLTGMGRDGAAGMLALHRAGWKTIAQDKATSIVWGMPGAAVQLDAVDRVLAIRDIGPAVSRWMNSHKV